ncbi:bifunctional diaminohydroxyphosphoribosylaminopyrimidine deaminase/5-amino-6-(5-phosphoribosylamino)uracil reductase RibD [Butyrivibrio sp. WCE2006]|uniref:bifunctional diaminohydroxyphosphoribosylaminopyrimidine deaminase/5-amino-6-(5-phosphoribosylamino)uracil reductase RibD n=1 Tax=Butyrivibrio sp. WCE2006 TaxID=1410611 RepID=UPI0005D26D76|nr:bifunctional diaminohydroxyphosphoribosylaminopyrimidine deaminase/5-amino-6-(5-phosphoribosylamino)uracil reductase RibD [Butyrivibrio sp. WCE2006]
MEDKSFMERALTLAKKGAGFVNPNPMVGAVIVKNGKIIGEGYHEQYGGLHAERNALKNCKESPKGATIYVTLEPCCHYGKTPPCTEAIIESGISRVVIGTLDVNPLVAGKGAKILADNGIRVEVGVLEKECRRLNRVFNKYMTTKLPYVVMKYAMTADGKIATTSGESKWITGDEARENVHRLRKNLSGIMVGVSTVIADDPSLNCRLDEPSKDPVRIICDSNLRTPFDSVVVKTANEGETIIATSSEDDVKIAEYEKRGCRVLRVPQGKNGIDLNYLMKEIGKIGIDSVLLEGGGTVNFSALESRIVDEVHIHMAPKIFGGRSKSPVEGVGISDIGNAIKLNPVNSSWCGNDLVIENEVIY